MLRKEPLQLAEQNTQKKSFFGGAAILAVGIVLVKIISAVYKIPLVNILGEGYQDFTNGYYVYNILLTISTAGFPVAVSKMVSEANTLGKQNQVHKVFRTAMMIFLTLGILSFFIMFFGSGFIANHVMNKPNSAACIKALAPAVVGVGCLSAFRGYAQGHGNMVPTSVSQVIEAVVKLVVGLGLAMVLLKLGKSNSIAAAGAIMGVTIGTLLALAYMFADYVKSRRAEPAGATDVPQSTSTILKRILQLAIPISLTSSSMAIITAMDNSLVQGRLMTVWGMTETEMSATMTNYSSVQNIYQLPASLMVAITASVIPAVSACFARKDHTGAARIVGSSLKVTALLAFPSGIGMIVLGEPLAALFYSYGKSSVTAELAGQCLSLLGFASIFVCIMLVCNSILQSHNVVTLPMITMLVGGIIMVIFDYVVVGKIGLLGSPLGTCVCYTVTAVLDLIIITRVVPNCPSMVASFLKPFLASAAMGLACWAFYRLTQGFLGSKIACLAAVVVAVIVYAVMIVVLKVLTREDTALMPKGDKIAKVLHIS
jgi:stage V sporulation protein B